MINVHFHAIGDYNLYAIGNNKTLDYSRKHCSLDDMFSYAERLIIAEDFDNVDVLDGATGELIATVTSDSEDCLELDDIFNPYEEMGFNPYSGCYDYDC